MPDGLYERDALAWAEHQANLLRRLAAGERLDEAVARSRWASEARTFLNDTRDRFTPSIRQRIDLADLYADGQFRVIARDDEFGTAQPMPNACPFALNDLLVRHPDVTALLARLTDGPR